MNSKDEEIKEILKEMGVDDVSGTIRVDPETGKIQTENWLGWQDTGYRIDPDTGKVQKEGWLGWQDTGKKVEPETGELKTENWLGWKEEDQRVDPETGRIQKRSWLGWQDTGYRIDPDTGKVQKEGWLGWQEIDVESGGPSGGGFGGGGSGGGGSTSAGGEYDWLFWLLLIVGILYGIYWLLVHFWVLLLVIPIGGGLIYGLYKGLVEDTKPIMAIIGVISIIAVIAGGIWLSYLAISNSFWSSVAVSTPVSSRLSAQPSESQFSKDNPASVSYPAFSQFPVQQPSKTQNAVMPTPTGSGELVVLVKKADGSPLQGAGVTIFSQKRNQLVSQKYTDSSGSATFNLTPGTYVAICEYNGVKLNHDVIVQAWLSVTIELVFK